MTEQSNAAAERSAHVERGPGRRIPGESFLVEVSPGIFKLKAVVEAERERDEARARAERAEAERDAFDFERNMNAAASLAARYGAERNAARAEAERLREALRQIVNQDWWDASGDEPDAVDGRCAEIARAALAAKEPGHE